MVDHNPAFIHNFWMATPEDFYYLTFLDNIYEVNNKDAKDFLHIRKYCTGNHSISDIAKLANMKLERVEQIISGLYDIGLQRREEFDL